MTRSTDAALASGVLLVVAVGAVVVDAPVTAITVGVGVVGAALLEALATWRASAVKRVWSRRWVRAGVAAGAIGVTLVGAAALGTWVLTAVGAGLGTYLLLLCGATLSRRLGV